MIAVVNISDFQKKVNSRLPSPLNNACDEADIFKTKGCFKQNVL
jgi:hypothetical protein